jgi:23S rRNA-/tRNA-specific pseudouridylate synthase
VDNVDESHNCESKKSKGSIETIAEDAWYKLVSKPQGMPTMSGQGESLDNSDALLIPAAKELNLSYKKATFCHRLDAPTGGLVVCSKTKVAEARIKSCFRNRLVQKRYRAIVRGKLEPDEGQIEEPIHGLPSSTKYRVCFVTKSAQYGHVTTVDLWPLTGRKHQLRKHMAGLGHPILGDEKYSYALDWPNSPYDGLLFLWALEIKLPHPECVVSASGRHGDMMDGGTDGDEIENVDEQNDVHGNQGDILVKLQAIESYEKHIYAILEEPKYYATYRDHEEVLWRQEHAVDIHGEVSNHCSGDGND